MKLNPDCIRDILFTIESVVTPNKLMCYPDESYELLNKYESLEIFYHIDQCEQYGFITGVSRTFDPHYYVRDLTPKGHEFLANIRSETLWNQTKDTAKKIGSFSLDAITKIAINIVSEAIKRQF